MADPGTPLVPGLDQELFDTATAFAGWCNAAGGIAGRKINLTLRDSKLFDVAARMIDACGHDFAMVGNGEAFDSAGVATRVKCGLPEVPAYDNSPEATSAPLVVQASPTPIQQQVTAAFLGAKNIYPNDTKVGLLVGNVPGVTTTGLRFKEAALISGFTVPYYNLYPATGIDNPQADVAQMKAAGVQILMQVGDINAGIALEKAMATAGWYPDAIVSTPDHYDNNLIKNAGSVLKNTWVVDAYYPFESANPATKQYVDIMKQQLPNGKIAALGRNAWSAWLLFATAVKACGSNLTRDCLLKEAGNHPDWNAGGLGPSVNTSSTDRKAGTCWVGLKADQSGFTVDPKYLPPTAGHEPFNCSPANVVVLKGDYSKS